MKVNQTFWDQIKVGDDAECWPFLGKLDYSGYGYCWDGRERRPHRTAWRLANERLIPKGAHVLHSCDVRHCCNPKHLRLGTHAENMRDKAERGRAINGMHPTRRITLGALSMMG